MIDLIGWIGSTCFAACALPQAWDCIKKGHARGLNGAFLFLWFMGEALSFIAVSIQAPISYLLINYILNLVFLFIICFYFFFPRRAE